MITVRQNKIVIDLIINKFGLDIYVMKCNILETFHIILISTFSSFNFIVDNNNNNNSKSSL